MSIVGLWNLCTPAYVYLVISAITLIVIGIQNIGNNGVYCIGQFSCPVSSTLVFAIKVIFILFWTWILNIICKGGGTIISWLLVLFPYILALVLILYFMMFSV